MFGTKTGNKDKFQKDADTSNAFELPYYKTLGHYLTQLGVNPFQDEKESVVRLTLLLTFWFTGFIPLYIRIWETIRQKDYDMMFEDSPQALTALITIVKVLNVYSNKSRFRYLFNYIIRGRKLMKTDVEIKVLNDVTMQGTVLASIYRRCLLLATVLFVSLPLVNPLMDVIVPLNETRPRQHFFHVNYVFMDEMENFFSVFVHLCGIVVETVVFIISIDSLYIIIIHHACGMFAACGYIIQNVTEKMEENNFTGTYEEYNRCIDIHYEALQFYDVLYSCCRNSYLIQMGLNMIILSTTAVQLVMLFDRPTEVIRVVAYLASELFHLYMVSLPGQRLLEHSSAIMDKVWTSNWYTVPVRAQKMLGLMILRASKPCVLTAAGLYEMTIESFGITVKTCTSYFTMFLSVRE